MAAEAQAAAARMTAGVGHAAEAEVEVPPLQVAITAHLRLGGLLMVQPAGIPMLRSRALTASMAARVAAKLAVASGEEQVTHGYPQPSALSKATTTILDVEIRRASFRMCLSPVNHLSHIGGCCKCCLRKHAWPPSGI